MAANLLAHLMVDLFLAYFVFAGANFADECAVRDYGCEIPGQLTMWCHYSLPPACSSYTAALEYYPSEDPTARHQKTNQSLKRRFEVPDVDQTRNYTHILTLLDPSTNSTPSKTTVTIDSQHIIKPFPIVGLRMNATKSFLTLSWNVSGGEETYRVNMTEDKDTRPTPDVYETTNATLTVSVPPASTWLVEIFRSYTTPEGHAIGLWSDPAVAHVTMSDGIAATPKLVPAVGKSADGKVTIYWQCLSIEEEHGRLEHYLLEWADGSDMVKAEDRTCSHTLRLPLPLPHSSTVRLSAVNNVGISPPALITIFPKETEPSPPEFRVWRDGGRVVCRWDDVEDDTSNCTVIWCTKPASDHQSCLDEVKWLTLSCDQRSAVIPLELQGPHKLLLGLSLSRRDARSSIVWTRCLYTTTALGVVEKFERASVQPPGGVEVRWKSAGCFNAPYISHYILTFCPVSGEIAQCAEATKDIVIGRRQTEFRVEKLTPGLMYRLTIRAVSLNHTVGPQSAAVTIRVHRASDSIGVILTAIIIIITASSVLLVVWRARGCRAREDIIPPEMLTYSALPRSGNHTEQSIERP